jgi:hypothetical protein
MCGRAATISAIFASPALKSNFVELALLALRAGFCFFVLLARLTFVLFRDFALAMICSCAWLFSADLAMAQVGTLQYQQFSHA